MKRGPTACQSVNETFVFTTCQTFNQIFYYPSDLNRIFYNASDFEVKLFPENPILLSFVWKDHFFCQFQPRKLQNWHFCAFSKIFILRKMFWRKSNLESNFPRRIRFWFIFFTKRPILNREVWNTSDFVPFFENSLDITLRFLQRVRLGVIFFTTRHILNRNFYNVVDFVLKT